MFLINIEETCAELREKGIEVEEPRVVILNGVEYGRE
jgi:hypothetical protein